MKEKTKSQLAAELEVAKKQIAKLKRALKKAESSRKEKPPRQSSKLVENTQREEKLNTSKEHYRALVETLDLSLCRWLPDTTLTYANEKYKQIFGLQGDAVGQKWLTFLPEETRASTAAFYGKVTEKPHTVTYEHPVTVEDGSMHQYH